jgi:hypothetical protein
MVIEINVTPEPLFAADGITIIDHSPVINRIAIDGNYIKTTCAIDEQGASWLVRVLAIYKKENQLLQNSTCPECQSTIESGVCQSAACKERLL